MSEVDDRLRDVRKDAWRTLRRGAQDSRSPARQVVMATKGLDGTPEARMVILRGADRKTSVLKFHTDSASEKVRELAVEPRASVVIWDKRIRLQIRCRVRVSTRPGLIEEWAVLSDKERRDYGGNVDPGERLERPEDFIPTSDPARFSVLLAIIDEIETLHLARDRNRRALFRRDDGFVGQWIAP